MASDKDFTERLSSGPLGGGCTYFGVPERAGTYTLTVRGWGAMKVVDDVVVTKDVCHVHPRHVTVTVPA